MGRAATTSTRKVAPVARLKHIKDLTPDPQNARQHGPRNVGTIVSALHEVGAARSIVIDETGRVLAGNATLEAAAEAGLTRLQVVDADGQTIIAVRRSGLTEAQKARLALFDNRAGELATGWNTDVLAELQGEGINLADLWSEAELARLLGTVDAEDLTIPESFQVLVTCKGERDQASLLERLSTEGFTCRALMS